MHVKGQDSWERLRWGGGFFRLLPTESLTASTLSGHLAVRYGIFGLLVDSIRDLKFVCSTINLAFLGIIVKLNFAGTVFNDFVTK